MIGRTPIVLFIIILFCGIVYGSELFYEEAVGRYNEGVRAQKARDFYSAQTSYQKSIIIDKGTRCKKYIFNNLGVLYIENGQVAKAEIAFREALRLDPDYKTAASNIALLYLKLAISYKDKGDTTRALDNFEKAFSYYPSRTFIIEGEKELKADNSEN